MSDLITLARATELVPNFPSADNAVMQDIITACSDLIKRWCNRDFVQTSYDELYDGQGTFNLLLDQYPIISIDRVMHTPTAVIMIRNTDSLVSRAQYILAPDSSTPPKPGILTLESVKNGVLTTHTVDCSTTTTIGDLATAINAFSADGWTAQALGIYSTWGTSDLRPPQGGYECRWMGASYLYLHSWGLPVYNQNPNIGEITTPYGFGRGYQNFRVVYTAGYVSIPNPVQQACAELAVAVYLSQLTRQNANVQGENLGTYSYTALADKSFNNLSIASRYSLHLFKNTRVVKFKPF